MPGAPTASEKAKGPLERPVKSTPVSEMGVAHA